MRLGVVAWTVLLAASCAPAPDRASPSGDDVSPRPAAASSATPGPTVPVSLVGEYRVAGIDGAELDAPVGIAVSIGSETLSYEPRCLGFAWRYRFDAGTLAIERDPRFGPQAGKDSQSVVCLPAVSPEMTRLAAAFDAATNVRRTSANGIEFSGGGHSVLLFSQ